MLKKIFLILLICSCIFPAKAEEIQYTAAGRWDSFYGYTFPDNQYKHQDKRKHFVNTFALNLGAKKEWSDDVSLGIYADLSAAVNKRQRNYSNGLWGHEIYGIFDQPYGRIMLGETANVANQFYVGTTQLGNFDVVDYLANPNWIKDKHTTAYRTLNSTAINTDGTTPKITYILPAYENLLVGLSYAPQTYSRTGLVNREAGYADKEGYVAALYYAMDLYDAELETSVGYGIFNQDDKDLSLSAKLYYVGWTLSGGWRKTYIDGTDYSSQKNKMNPRLPELFDNYREGSAWNVGLGYEFGPLKTALSYFESKSENTKNKDKMWILSNEFQYDKHLSFYLAGAKADFRGQAKEESDKGYAAITGISVKF